MIPHTHREGLESLVIGVIQVFGVSGAGFLSRSTMAEESQRKRLGLVFVLVQGWGQSGICVVGISSQHPKEGAPRLSYQLAQLGSTQEKVRL